MPTWLYFLIAAAMLSALLAAVLFLLPLRIFLSYSRKNNSDSLRISLRVWRWTAGRIDAVTSEDGSCRIDLRVWRWNPGRMEIAPLGGGRYRINWRLLWRLVEVQFFLPAAVKKYMAGSAGRLTLRKVKSSLGKFFWQRFDLLVAIGKEDPALTGLMAGAGWAAGGTIMGILTRFLRFESTPRFMIRPLFFTNVLQVRFEAVGRFSVWTGIQLLLTLKRSGGA